MLRTWTVVVLAALTTSLTTGRPSKADPIDLVRTALEQACFAETPSEVHAMVRNLADTSAWPPPRVWMSMLGWRVDLMLPIGELVVEQVPRRNEGRVRVELSEGRRSAVLAVADALCRINAARRLIFEHGSAAWIEVLDGELQPTGDREPLNSPVPEGRDHGGVRVALVDTGVNYTLEEIAARLARDSDNRLIGYDFWDMDTRPFDADLGRSRFFPGHHGTQTAALLLRTTPVASIAVYRYPYSDMDRMGALVRDVSAHGIRLVNVSLTGRRAQDWLAFEEAIAAHPELLVIAAAGNDGRNLDERPVFPAAFTLPNILTVTAAAEDGTLVPGANWGPRSVDLMAPAETITTTGFDGRPVTVSGSSYAAVRVTAMAACLLKVHPDWNATRLKQAIIAESTPSPHADRVARGFLSEDALSVSVDCAAGTPDRRVVRYGGG